MSKQPILPLWFGYSAKLLLEPTDIAGGHAEGLGDSVRLLPRFQTGQDAILERFPPAEVGNHYLHPTEYGAEIPHALRSEELKEVSARLLRNKKRPSTAGCAQDNRPRLAHSLGQFVMADPHIAHSVTLSALRDQTS